VPAFVSHDWGFGRIRHRAHVRLAMEEKVFIIDGNQWALICH
jgi:hypothetical protein